jgi:hypothetical protein
MMTPTSTYKMSKATKRGLALILDPHKRGAWKRAMIDAELSAAVRPREKKSRNQPDLEV